ncbi:MAG: HD domain-containing protein [Planctomycetes bacterium]|nr:HD domain-containing protein [Planctomycetota bacterium]
MPPQPGPANGLAELPDPALAVPVADLRDGTTIDQVLLVTEKEKRMGQSGKFYGHLQFRDKSGEISGRLWDKVELIFPRFEAGHFVRVRAEVKTFNNRLQLNVGRIDPVDEARVNLSEFLPHTRKSVAALEARLREIAGGLRSEPLRALLFAFLDDVEFMAVFKKVPAAKRNHHAWVGGLLEHVVSLSEAALRITGWYRFLDADLVLAGVFFHDLGKVRELAVDRMPEYTDEGRLVGHISIGVQLATERAMKLPGFPAPLLLALQHIILSHHGELAFGSPVLPQTPEAVAVAFLDNLDAKLSAFEQLLLDHQGVPGNWTSYTNIFSRPLFRGVDPAADAERRAAWTAPPGPAGPPTPSKASAPAPAPAPAHTRQPRAAPPGEERKGKDGASLFG